MALIPQNLTSFGRQGNISSCFILSALGDPDSFPIFALRLNPLPCVFLRFLCLFEVNVPNTCFVCFRFFPMTIIWTTASIRDRNSVFFCYVRISPPWKFSPITFDLSVAKHDQALTRPRLFP